MELRYNNLFSDSPNQLHNCLSGVSNRFDLVTYVLILGINPNNKMIDKNMKNEKNKLCGQHLKGGLS